MSALHPRSTLPLPRPIAALALALALAACGGRDAAAGAGTAAAPAPESAADPAAVHQEILVLDGHADVLLPDTPKRYWLPDGGKRTSFERVRQGGVDAIVFSIAVGPGPEDAQGLAKARQDAEAKLAAVQEWIAGSGGQAELARSADDIERLHREGKVAVLLGFQNARILGTDLAAFDRFHQAGVRVAGLAHAGHNAFADSSRPQDGVAERHGGLSELGRRAVARFNDLGVLIDVSQLTPAALKQTVELSRVPVVATHSNARALVDNSRNLSDGELDLIKAKGGVVLVTPFKPYLRAPDDAWRAKIARLRAEFGLPEQFAVANEGSDAQDAPTRERFHDALKQNEQPATLSDLVDHLDYIARRIGVEHVGIGSDFDHGAGVTGFDSEADAANVTAELLRRGYTREQVAAIWGGNFLRVVRAAEAGRRQG
ncbi:dipeptidase [Pseudoxanthomonas sp. GW2]|uniref:dipeptidase n=1 Tax=Pseudoxanthomonas sp. GW2 TaxID=1211114 RepID=UPI0004745AE4|nr:dipeptidase [Pseudoxanthomonas sp. GW2]